MEASHLSSMSLRVASGVDFFVGMTAAVELLFATGELLLVAAGELLFAAGELLLVAAGELLFSGAGDFSVVTDTLGSMAGDSDFSGAVASGAGAGVVASS